MRMSRLLSDYSKLEKEIQLFDRDDLLSIELNAGALDIQGCLDVLGIEMDDVAEADLVLIKRVHKRGARKAVALAFSKLNSAMDGRNGGQIALELLKVKCSEFSILPEAIPTGSGFAFNVIMPEGEKA